MAAYVLLDDLFCSSEAQTSVKLNLDGEQKGVVEVRVHHLWSL